LAELPRSDTMLPAAYRGSALASLGRRCPMDIIGDERQITHRLAKSPAVNFCSVGRVSDRRGGDIHRKLAFAFEVGLVPPIRGSCNIEVGALARDALEVPAKRQSDLTCGGSVASSNQDSEGRCLSGGRSSEKGYAPIDVCLPIVQTRTRERHPYG
jgi:hypothetical protein